MQADLQELDETKRTSSNFWALRVKPLSTYAFNSETSSWSHGQPDERASERTSIVNPNTFRPSNITRSVYDGFSIGYHLI